MIHDGGLPVEEAERKAWKIVHHRVEMYKRRDGSVEFKHSLVVPGAKKAASNQVAKQEEQPQLPMSFEDFRARARERFGYE